MKLDIYLKSKRGLAAQVATALDCSPVLISQWSKSRPVPIERCVPIEHATEGQVMRWDLRPNDWWQIWPELLEHPAAPIVASEQLDANQSLAFKRNHSADCQVFQEVNHG